MTSFHCIGTLSFAVETLTLCSTEIMGYLPFQADDGVCRGRSGIQNGLTAPRAHEKSDKQPRRQILREPLLKGRSGGGAGNWRFLPAEVEGLALGWWRSSAETWRTSFPRSSCCCLLGEEGACEDVPQRWVAPLCHRSHASGQPAGTL